MRPSDDELARMLADAAPRAPRDTAERVLARARRERALRLRVWAGAAVAVAAAAALLLLMKAHDPAAPASRVEARTLAAGQSWTTGDPLAKVRVDGPAEARLQHGLVFVTAGAGRLFGNGAQIDSLPALLTATGVGAEVGFEVTRRAPATVLEVHVLTGGARIAPHGSRAVTLLGPGDHALVAAGAPVLAVRAPRPTTPAPVAARRRGATSSGTPTHAAATAPAGEEPALELDKDDVTTVIRGLLPQIKACYEKALETTPDLSGRTLVRFKLRGHDGKAEVEEGEIIPGDNNDLDSPAVEQCILETIGKAEFPASNDGVAIVDYPFALLPKPAEE